MITKEPFAAELQKAMFGINQKVSKKNAWLIFKKVVDVLVDSVISDSDNKIQLSGIGVFDMLKAKPRRTKKGAVDYVPRLRWKPSTRINAAMEQRTGQVPDMALMAKKRAELMSSGGLVSNLPDCGLDSTGQKELALTRERVKEKQIDDLFNDDFTTDVPINDFVVNAESVVEPDIVGIPEQPHTIETTPEPELYNFEDDF